MLFDDPAPGDSEKRSWKPPLGCLAVGILTAGLAVACLLPAHWRRQVDVDLLRSIAWGHRFARALQQHYVTAGELPPSLALLIVDGEVDGDAFEAGAAQSTFNDVRIGRYSLRDWRKGRVSRDELWDEARRVATNEPWERAGSYVFARDPARIAAAEPVLLGFELRGPPHTCLLAFSCSAGSSYIRLDAPDPLSHSLLVADLRNARALGAAPLPEPLLTLAAEAERLSSEAAQRLRDETTTQPDPVEQRP